MIDARITAKTTRPGPTRAIARPRLAEQVAAAGVPRVILITGQAAQGKTTLAAELSADSAAPWAWMHLDAGDRDPVNLLRLLVHALMRCYPDLDGSGFLTPPGVALGPSSDPGRMAEKAGACVAKAADCGPVRLVMDGLEHLDDDPACLLLIEKVLAAMDAPGCLMLVSRQTPALKLESLRVSRQLLTLTNADLAFTLDEIDSFYREMVGLRLNRKQLQTLGKLTDGWAGGLVLVWEALRQVPEALRTAFIDNDLPAVLKGEGRAYFGEAVFAGLQAAQRNLLMRTSIFETIDAHIASQLLPELPGDQVRQMLADLARQNRFIQPFADAKSGWGYRTNGLFRDFLQAELARSLDRSSRQALYLKAADLAWEAQHFEGAISFFLRAGAFGKAAAGIKKSAMGLAAQGRFGDLSHWIRQLPADLVQGDEWLVFYGALGQRSGGGRRSIEPFEKAWERFVAVDDARGQLLALAHLIETAVFIGQPPASLHRWLQQAWQLLETMSEHRLFAYAKAVLWMQVAFGYLATGSDLQQGLSASRNALLLARTIGDQALVTNASIIQVFGFTVSGALAEAEAGLAAIQHQPETYPEYRTLKQVVQMELALARGDAATAMRLAEANQADIDAHGLLFLYPVHVELCGRLQLLQGDVDKLTDTIRHLQDVATLAAHPLYQGLALRLRAASAYHQGRFEAARRWAGEALAALSDSKDESLHTHACGVVAGLADLHLGDGAAARQQLTAAAELFERLASALLLIEARLGLSLVARQAGDGAEADRWLHGALEVAAEHKATALPTLVTEDIQAACAPALENGHPLAASARCLLAAAQKRPAARAGESLRPTATMAPPERGPAIDIRTLGAFAVAREKSGPIADDGWGGLRQRLLLKAIVVHGCRDVPKEVLMDALWPESSSSAAGKRFKVTLHRLRKVLEPDRERHNGASCIVLKDQRVSLDLFRCRVDVNDFLAAIDRMRQFKRDDQPLQCLDACRQASEIYGGDFLAEEPYLSWVEMKRTALRDQYLMVLLEMTALYAGQEKLARAETCCRRAIAADPLAEQAHQQLMRLLHRQGRRNAVIKAYRQLESRLADELDTTPDEKTRLLYERIVG